MKNISNMSRVEGPIYSCLSIGFAIMADVDIESECLRLVLLFLLFVKCVKL